MWVWVETVVGEKEEEEEDIVPDEEEEAERNEMNKEVSLVRLCFLVATHWSEASSREKKRTEKERE